MADVKGLANMARLAEELVRMNPDELFGHEEEILIELKELSKFRAGLEKE